MKIQELQQKLQSIYEKYGDLPIVGGYMHDDEPLDHVTLVDEEGCNAEEIKGNDKEPTTPVGVFLE